MSRPTLLDLFCKAGGASKGYMDAGFLVVGVDMEPQPNYVGHAFYQADALEFVRAYGHMFDAIAASPPCQRYTMMRQSRWRERDYPDLIEPTREALRATGRPFVIENVVGAPLLDPVKLCGSMFGLATREGSQLRRHRIFETNWPLVAPGPCLHAKGSPIGVYGGGQHPQRRRGEEGSALAHFGVEARREAMGITWMTGKELSQAIPPAYTHWVGAQLIRACFPNRRVVP